MLNNPFASKLATTATPSSSGAAANPFKKLSLNKLNLNNNTETVKEETPAEEAVATNNTVETIAAEETVNADECAACEAEDNSVDNIPGEKVINPFAKPETPNETPTSEVCGTANNIEEDKIETEENNTEESAPVCEEIDDEITDEGNEAEETVVETAPKRRKRRSKNNTADDTVKGSVEVKTTKPSVQEVPAKITNNSTVSFDEAINEFCSVAADDEWVAFKEDIEKAYKSITIPSDLNSATMLGIICNLSNLRNRIWNQHQYYKNQYDAMASKEPEGVIERVKRLYMDADANNDMLRRRSGIIACIDYKTKDGATVNLYDLFDEVRARYYFLKSMMDNIDFQKNLLITASSALKLESSLTE